MMRNTLSWAGALAAVALMLSLSTPAIGDTAIINLEEAAEIVDLRINTSGSAATITGKLCDECETIRLTADDSTLVRRQGARIALDDAARLRGKGATVLFDPETRRVTRILFWN